MIKVTGNRSNRSNNAAQEEWKILEQKLQALEERCNGRSSARTTKKAVGTAGRRRESDCSNRSNNKNASVAAQEEWKILEQKLKALDETCKKKKGRHSSTGNSKHLVGTIFGDLRSLAATKANKDDSVSKQSKEEDIGIRRSKGDASDHHYSYRNHNNRTRGRSRRKMECNNQTKKLVPTLSRSNKRNSRYNKDYNEEDWEYLEDKDDEKDDQTLSTIGLYSNVGSCYSSF